MTQEEKKRFERQTESYSYGYKYEAPKEKAVKINVKAVKPIAVEEPVKIEVKSEETTAGNVESNEKKIEVAEVEIEKEELEG